MLTNHAVPGSCFLKKKGVKNNIVKVFEFLEKNVT